MCKCNTIALISSFLAQDVIYTSRAYATMSVSVCLSVCPSICDGSALAHYSQFRFQIPIPIYHALRSRCMRVQGKGSSLGRVEGSSRAMPATARPSCLFCLFLYFMYVHVVVFMSTKCQTKIYILPTVYLHKNFRNNFSKFFNVIQ